MKTRLGALRRTVARDFAFTFNQTRKVNKRTSTLHSWVFSISAFSPPSSKGLHFLGGLKVVSALRCQLQLCSKPYKLQGLGCRSMSH